MQCKVCCYETYSFNNAKILNKYLVTYYRCPHCGFIQTEFPFWLDEAYNDAITDSDIGLLGRNYDFAQKVSALIKFCLPDAKTYLDYGGGRGIFVRLMRDRGFDFEWYDKYCQNIFSPQFVKSKEHYDVVTAFELFEHLPEPLQEIEMLVNLGTSVIFSTELLPANPPNIGSWWYYAPEHGQHISFYTEKSLEFIAKRFNRMYSHYGNLHILGKEEISPFKFKLCCRFPGLIHRFIKRASLLPDDYKFITGKALK